jgi:hypothetical protein
MISQWIDRGATIDEGVNQAMETRLVAVRSMAATRTHAELIDERQALAAQNWRLIMSDVDSNESKTESFCVLGTARDKYLVEVAALAESLAPKIKAALKSDKNAPFIKGNATIFVFDRRYDFEELGKMLEKREFEEDAIGHWNYTTVDAYAVLLNRRTPVGETAQGSKVSPENQVELTRRLSALHLASVSPGLPRWFADGIGYWVAEGIFAREDTVKMLDEKAQAIAQKMENPDDFASGQMSDSDAALAAYLFVKHLKSDSRRFNRLLQQLQKGEGLEEAFQMAYQTTLKQWIAARSGR